MIRVDHSSSIAVSEQLVIQIASAIDAGKLMPGDRLPSIRSLAKDLGVAVGTVARAYRELESGGWAHSDGRRGTTVCRHSESVEIVSEAISFTKSALAAKLTAAEMHRALDLALLRLAQENP